MTSRPNHDSNQRSPRPCPNGRRRFPGTLVIAVPDVNLRASTPGEPSEDPVESHIGNDLGGFKASKRRSRGPAPQISAVPRHVYLGTVLQSVALVLVAPVAGRISDRIGRRRVFVMAAAVIYAASLFVIAGSPSLDGYLVGMGIGGVGFGMYMAVDLALVVDVLADPLTAAKDLGVLNIAGALPFTLAPAVAPALLAVGGGSYAVLYTVAGVFALLGAAAILPVRGVRWRASSRTCRLVYLMWRRVNDEQREPALIRRLSSPARPFGVQPPVLP